MQQKRFSDESMIYWHKNSHSDTNKSKNKIRKAALKVVSYE